MKVQRKHVVLVLVILLIAIPLGYFLQRTSAPVPVPAPTPVVVVAEKSVLAPAPLVDVQAKETEAAKKAMGTRKARLQAEAARKRAETRLEAERAEAKAKTEADRLTCEAAEKARLGAEVRARAEAEQQAAEKVRLEAEARAKAKTEADRLTCEAAEKARLGAEVRARAEAEAKKRLVHPLEKEFSTYVKEVENFFQDLSSVAEHVSGEKNSAWAFDKKVKSRAFPRLQKKAAACDASRKLLEKKIKETPAQPGFSDVRAVELLVALDKNPCRMQGFKRYNRVLGYTALLTVVTVPFFPFDSVLDNTAADVYLMQDHSEELSNFKALLKN